MEQERLLGRTMAHAGRLSRMYLDEQLRSFDITPVQGHAIRFLAHQTSEAAVTHRDLEEALRLKPSTVNGVVERMEEKELIVRSVSKADGRCRLIRLTEKGLSLSLAIDEAIRRTESMICSCLTAEEQSQLYACLVKIVKTMKQEVSHHD